MNSFFGKNWFIKFLTLLTFGFWPIIYFYGVKRSIELNPAKFTEEWIKAFLIVIIIGTLLKYYDKVLKTREEKFEQEKIKFKLFQEIETLEISEVNLNGIILNIEKLKKNGILKSFNVDRLKNASLLNFSELSDVDINNIKEDLKKLKIKLNEGQY